MTVADCVMCGKIAKAGDLLVADLDTSRVYPVLPRLRSLVLRRHATELYELPAAERRAHVDEVSRVAEALARVFRPVKMNYALLGNQVPHIHWHLVPRLPTDPDPQQPIWRAQYQPAPLAPAAARERIAVIRRALAASS